MPDNKDLKIAIQTALAAFEKKPLAECCAAICLNALGYRSEQTRRSRLSRIHAEQFQAEFDPHSEMKSETRYWMIGQSVDLLFQVTDDDICAKRVWQACSSFRA